MSIEEIATFVQAVEDGSMAAASRSLGVPTSTVSRRIRRLEQELGVQLVDVHARLFRPTESGDALFRRSSSAVRDLREAMHALRDGGDTMRGQLRISAALDVGASESMAAMLGLFRQDHPGLELLMDLTDDRVDLVDQGVDFAFRIHVGPVEGQGSLMVRRLGTIAGGLFASPTYLARHGHPTSVADLADHALLAPTFGVSWQMTHRTTGERCLVEPNAAIRSTSMSFMAPAARSHLGIAPIPDLVARTSVHRGDLVQVLPDWRLMKATLSLLWPSSRLPAPRRRAFLDFAVEHTRDWCMDVG